MANRNDRWSSAWCLSIAVFLIGFALQLNFGKLSPGAILLLALAIPFAVLGVTRPRWPAIGERNVRFALGAILVAELMLLAVWPPGASAPLQRSDTILPFRIGVIAVALLAVTEMLDWRALSRMRLPILLGFWAIAAAWVIVLEPAPANDVWFFQQIGGQSLLSGMNPYAIQMPNIYAPDVSLYAPEVIDGSTLRFGFPYPPLTLAVGLPGLILFGDVRFAHVFVVVAAAALMATIRPGPIARTAALCFLFTPRSLFIVEQGWTDAQTVLAVTLVAWIAIRRPALVGRAVGLGIALKQYMALLLPLALLLVPRPVGWRAVSTATGALFTALIVTVPVAAWDVTSFWRSVIQLQFLQPFRSDSLSFLAWFQLNDPSLAAIGFAMLVPSGLLIVWRAARTPAGFAASTALVYLLFFAFNKQAFANYYYLVIGAMCCAIAATWPPRTNAAVGPL